MQDNKRPQMPRISKVLMIILIVIVGLFAIFKFFIYKTSENEFGGTSETVARLLHPQLTKTVYVYNENGQIMRLENHFNQRSAKEDGLKSYKLLAYITVEDLDGYPVDSDVREEYVALTNTIITGPGYYLVSYGEVSNLVVKFANDYSDGAETGILSRILYVDILRTDFETFISNDYDPAFYDYYKYKLKFDPANEFVNGFDQAVMYYENGELTRAVFSYTNGYAGYDSLVASYDYKDRVEALSIPNILIETLNGNKTVDYDLSENELSFIAETIFLNEDPELIFF